VWPIHRSADDDDKVAGSVVCLINWLCPQRTPQGTNDDDGEA
jgi:hypothetical protein